MRTASLTECSWCTTEAELGAFAAATSGCSGMAGAVGTAAGSIAVWNTSDTACEVNSILYTKLQK